jgi:ferredoxin
MGNLASVIKGTLNKTKAVYNIDLRYCLLTQQSQESVMQLIQDLTITTNGQLVRLKDIAPTMTLLEYLRLHGYIGTKEGCGDWDCGACTVAVIG